MFRLTSFKFPSSSAVKQTQQCFLMRRNFFSKKETEVNYEDRVNLKIENEIATVTLNRPTKMNSLDMKMFQAIADTATKLRSEKGVKCVIIKGEGRAFSSGLDVSSVMKDPLNMKSLLDKPQGTPYTNLAQDVCYLWRLIPAPVIACMHGVCFGGGLQVALGADFRYVTPDCKVSILEAKWGLIPDMGLSPLLKELMPMDTAKELMMTGKIFSGEEAKGYNLVTKVCTDPYEEAVKFAELIKTMNPDAVAGSKILAQNTYEASNEDALNLETELQRKLLGSWNQLARSSRSMHEDIGKHMPYKERNAEFQEYMK